MKYLMAAYFVGLVAGGVLARTEDNHLWLATGAVIVLGALALTVVDAWRKTGHE